MHGGKFRHLVIWTFLCEKIFDSRGSCYFCSKNVLAAVVAAAVAAAVVFAPPPAVVAVACAFLLSF